MTSDEKTTVPSLLKYIHSDLFTLGNISKSTILNVESDTLTSNQTTNTFSNDDSNGYIPDHRWETVIGYLPLDYYRMIESYPDMFYVEAFDKRYIRNPKLCAYEKYGSTNMWRPLMILNRCPSIVNFDFDFIRYYNITTFSNVLSVLISRQQHG